MLNYVFVVKRFKVRLECKTLDNEMIFKVFVRFKYFYIICKISLGILEFFGEWKLVFYFY